MRNKLRWGDFVIVGAVLAAAAVLALVLALRAAGGQLYAEVWHEGARVARVRLNEDTNEQFDVDGHVLVVLSGKTARVLQADCADQVCVRTGTLTRAGQVAVCLPNRVIVKLIGQTEEIDAIVS